MAKKSDFMQDKLRAFVLELADLKGYENPSTYLNEKLDEVKEFNDFSFECDFYLNIHYLCKENADKFWSNSHKNDISDWLRKSRIWTDAFDTTWQALPPQPISVNESRTKKVIFETITNIDKQGWQYAFVSETDYNLFTDLLTNFFEYKPYTLPETIIQLKRTCKTKVAKALGEIHKELSNENKLSTDTKYFQLIRVLSHFEKETEGDLYKALTR